MEEEILSICELNSSEKSVQMRQAHLFFLTYWGILCTLKNKIVRETVFEMSPWQWIIACGLSSWCQFVAIQGNIKSKLSVWLDQGKEVNSREIQVAQHGLTLPEDYCGMSTLFKTSTEKHLVRTACSQDHKDYSVLTCPNRMVTTSCLMDGSGA